MTVYTKETALYDTGAIANDIGAAGKANEMVTEVGSTGVKIHPSGQSDSNIVDYTLIDADGMEVFDGGVSVAEFGASGARVGKTAGPRTVIQSTGVDMYGAADGSEELAHFGYGDTWSASTTQTTKPYYKIGKSLEEPSAWVSGASYEVGDVVSYNGKKWVCWVSTSSTTPPPGYYWQLVNGSYSLSEGINTIAGGAGSHAEGNYTKALGEYSHAEGSSCIAALRCAHAEGSGTVANHYSSHAEGNYTKALGQNSHAGGDNTIAQHGQYAIGKWNVADNSSAPKYAFIIGNGYGGYDAENDVEVEERSNAFMVDWDGGVYSNGHSTPIGTVYQNSKGNLVRTANTVGTQLLGASVTLPPGSYVIVARWCFNTGTSGVSNRNLEVAIGSGASSLWSSQRINCYSYGYTVLQCMHISEIQSQTTVYCMASGSQATNSNYKDTSYIYAVRIA